MKQLIERLEKDKDMALPSDRAFVASDGAAEASPPKASIPSAYRRRTRDYPHPDGWGKRLPDGSWPKTCPASRHARMICEGLRDPKSSYRQLLIDGGYDPDHWASSIESVIQSLWDARQYLEWQELPPTRRYRFNGHWVPIASAIEARSGETAQTGSTEGESAVAKPDAQKDAASLKARDSQGEQP